MPHDDHFLSRLDRLSLLLVEFALTLYRDAPMVKVIFQVARPRVGPAEDPMRHTIGRMGVEVLAADEAVLHAEALAHGRYHHHAVSLNHPADKAFRFATEDEVPEALATAALLRLPLAGVRRLRRPASRDAPRAGDQPPRRGGPLLPKKYHAAFARRRAVSSASRGAARRRARRRRRCGRPRSSRPWR